MSLGGTIGALLAPAVGIAVSPVPIAAVILMLFSPRRRVNGLAFLLAWVVGIAAVVVVVMLIPGFESDDRGPSDAAGWLKLALGVILLAAGIRRWRGRPAPGEEVEPPGWMDRIDGMGPGGAAGLGLLLSAANPKNLVLAAAGGVTIASAALGAGEATVAVVVFVAIAASTVVLPVVGYLVAGARVEGELERAKDWLIRNNGVVLAVLFLVFGVVLVGEGLQILGR